MAILAQDLKHYVGTINIVEQMNLLLQNMEMNQIELR
jgi:hypothetical protein